MTDFTLDDLRSIMRGSAGEDESVNLDGAIADSSFTDLGYDSLAVLEIMSQLAQRYGIRIPEEDAAELVTPAQAVTYVNSRMSKVV